MLDLHRLRHVNDVLDCAFGDRMLHSVAQLLQQAVRPGDLVAQLLPQADAALALQVAARIASAFEAPLALDGQRVDLSAGLGIACGPAHTDDAETLLSRAEAAMYAAKHGKRGAQWHETALNSGARAAPRRWRAGSTRSAAWCRRCSSSPLPSRWAARAS